MKTQPAARPAMRTTAALMIIVARCSPKLTPADDHIADLQCRSRDRSNEGDVAADHFDIFQHLAEIAGNRYLLDCMHELAVLDPKTHRAAGIITGHRVHAKADQLDNIQALLDRTNDLLGRMSPAGQVEIRWTDRDDA